MSVLDMSKRNQILVDLAIGRVVCRFLAERSYDVLSAQFGCSRPTIRRALRTRPQSLTPEEVDVIRKARAEWEVVRPIEDPIYSGWYRQGPPGGSFYGDPLATEDV